VRTFLRLAYGTHLAQVAELVDALVSGTSGAIRGGSSPLLGTIADILLCFQVLKSRVFGADYVKRDRAGFYLFTSPGFL
jgi:hypothetical protein